MKKISIILLIAATAVACNSHSNTEETETVSVSGRYGDSTWTSEGAVTAAQLMDSLAGKDSVYAITSGIIAAACQAKGCWMTMDMAGNEMQVKFKDYGFFVPKNSAEHNATMRGWAYQDTLSVADQIEYAKDAEATAEEIATITAPKVKLTFMADGVIIE
jgi:hypothetical protein